MLLVFQSPIDDPEPWRRALTGHLPDLDFRTSADPVAPGDVTAALVWHPPRGWLASLPNLALVQSLGAGVDHILSDPDYPVQVPLVRLVDPAMTAAMTNYIVFQTLRLHLRDLDYRQQQAAADWRPWQQPPAGQRRVGVLGLGTLGSDAALALQRLGFTVSGWSRRRRQLPGITSFAGNEELPAFLAGSDILVCLLPHTAETDGLINAETLALLPPGAGLINAGRGALVVADHLIAALDHGTLAAAILDVTVPEPLPPDHPFWHHPRIIITPHIAAQTNAASAAAVVAATLRQLQAGQPLANRVDPTAGY